MGYDEAFHLRVRWAQQCSSVIQNIICPHLLAALCNHTSAGKDVCAWISGVCFKEYMHNQMAVAGGLCMACSGERQPGCDMTSNDLLLLLIIQVKK